MEIFFVTKFKRQYKKLPKHIKKSLAEKEAVFRKNPFHPSLKTHKLHGRFSGFWAFSADCETRIIFEFKTKEIIWVHTVGKHDIYE